MWRPARPDSSRPATINSWLEPGEPIKIADDTLSLFHIPIHFHLYIVLGHQGQMGVSVMWLPQVCSTHHVYPVWYSVYLRYPVTQKCMHCTMAYNTTILYNPALTIPYNTPYTIAYNTPHTIHHSIQHTLHHTTQYTTHHPPQHTPYTMVYCTTTGCNAVDGREARSLLTPRSL